ncbi:unnamed protein product [Closterium sp. Yama58-4]|nr:unnamed protein product [Closterium sp. Yama58-4]
MACYSPRTAAVVALLLHAACVASPHRLVVGHVWRLPSNAENIRREMAVKAPATCPAGVVCPTGAYCVVDSGGLPFCKCLTGQGIVNGACMGGMSWKTVGTSVVLYNAPSFATSPATLAPAVLRAPAPNSSACAVVPKGFNGTVGSLRIMWNVNDGAGEHLVCGKVVFWDRNDCSGSSAVYEIPGKWTAASPTKFNYATTSVKKAVGVVATGRSFSCLAAVKPPVTDLCATAACPPNSKCVLTNSSFAQCVCKFGTTMVPEGYCVDSCAVKQCGTGGNCVILSNGQPYCDCKDGYEQEFVTGSCIGEGQCRECKQDTFGLFDIPYAYCPPGYNMHSGACLPGVLPDVADISISIYSVPALGSSGTAPPYIF